MESIPYLLEEQIQGKSKFISSSCFSSGFSVVGTKTVAVTDYPGFYIHDTGGLFGQEQVWVIEKQKIEESVSAERDTNQRLCIRVEFDGSHSCHLTFEGSKAQELENELLRPYISQKQNTQFDSLLHYPFYCKFQDEDAISEKLLNSDTDFTSSMKKLVSEGHLLCRLTIKTPRLQVFTDELDVEECILDLPLRHLNYRQESGVVYFESEVQILGHDINEFRLDLCENQDILQELERVIKQQQSTKERTENRPQKGATGSAFVSNLLKDEDEFQSDIVLGDKILQLFDAQMGKLIYSFELESPKVSIHGTSESFFISDSQDCIIRVAPSYKSFQTKLLVHPKIVQIAQRTRMVGAFLAKGRIGEKSGYWRIEIDSQYIQFLGNCAPGSFGYHELDEFHIEPETSESEPNLCLKSGTKEIILSSTYEMLESISSKIRHLQLCVLNSKQASSILNRIITLEGEYLLYSLFGNFLEFHEGLEAAYSQENLLIVEEQNKEISKLPLPKSEKEHLELITLFISGITPLREFVEDIIYYFPRFLMSCDEAIFDNCGGIPSQLAQLELIYNRIVGNLNIVTSQISRIEAEVRQFHSLRNALNRQKASWGTTAISLGASLINPIFLIGAAGSAYNAMQSSMGKEDTTKENLESATLQCIEHWNRLMKIIIPPVLYRVSDTFYPSRCKVAQMLKSRLENVKFSDDTVNSIRSRLVYLENFLQFPNYTLSDKPRVQRVRQLQGLMKGSRIEHFHPF